MKYIPPATSALIRREEPEARVRGFRELFGHLDEQVGRNKLRELVVGFFNDPEYGLDEYLRQLLHHFYSF